MTDSMGASIAPTAAAMTVEADLVDWAEQHDVVALPDDEYPHVEDTDVLVNAPRRFAFG